MVEAARNGNEGGVETKHGSFSAWGFLSGEILVKTTGGIHACETPKIPRTEYVWKERNPSQAPERKKERKKQRKGGNRRYRDP
jgi:hypothetical protein